MLKALKAQMVFYRNIIVPSLIISVILSVFTIVAARADINENQSATGVLAYLFPVIISKAITTASFILYYFFIRKDELYFYYNLGISKKQIIIFTTVADYLILGVFLFISEMILKIF